MKGTLKERMLPAPVGGGFAMEGYWVWCGSVVKGEDGRYHMFASRWPKTYPMHPGWLVASEIVRASCDTPGGTYKFEEIVLPARGPQYWDGRSTHCPQILKIGGKYVLYYTGTTHPFGDAPYDLKLDDPRVIVARAGKRVGIAVSDSVFGPWQRFDRPMIDTRPGSFDNFLISNVIPCIRPDGKLLVVYKTRSYLKPPYTAYSLHGEMELGALIADRYDGDFMSLRTDRPLLEDKRFLLEDPFVWYDEDGYNMMAKDMNGKLCGEFHGSVYAHSDDGLHWDFRRDSVFASRKILWDDGVVREMGSLERPFILFEDGKPTHAFFATSDGHDNQGFDNCTKTWNMVVPLKTE